MAIRAENDRLLTHLELLEAEAIHVIRESVAVAESPVLLYSIGKDSAVLLHLARKAFFPGTLPFPLLHIDTLWKFKEMYSFRDSVAQSDDISLLVFTNPEGIKNGINPLTHGSEVHTEIMKTQSLKLALDKYRFDIALGGARRDEEKSRAKERIFSLRSESHSWDPRDQRPELWNLYNCKKRKNQSFRVFPISNWTELDIWLYIHKENISVVPLYFAESRLVIKKDNMLVMLNDDRFPVKEGDEISKIDVRFRTLGCYPLTGAIRSQARTVPEIIFELLQSKMSERQNRSIDSDSHASMEKKKLEGYF